MFYSSPGDSNLFMNYTQVNHNYICLTSLLIRYSGQGNYTVLFDVTFCILCLVLVNGLSAFGNVGRSLRKKKNKAKNYTNRISKSILALNMITLVIKTFIMPPVLTECRREQSSRANWIKSCMSRRKRVNLQYISSPRQLKSMTVGYAAFNTPPSLPPTPTPCQKPRIFMDQNVKYSNRAPNSKRSTHGDQKTTPPMKFSFRLKS